MGQALTKRLLANDALERLVIFSRDEWKQAEMATQYTDPRLRFFLGDVRDPARLLQAFRGMHTIIHAAALKRVEVIGYNPAEAVKTNIQGTMNVLAAAAQAECQKVLLVSSDKAVEPLNLYGATKMTAEWLTVTANCYYYPLGLRCSTVRYGNVLGSRGSVVPIWREAVAKGEPIQITDDRCTRFIITMQGAVDLVLGALADMCGGEIFVPMLPAARILDLAEAVAPGCPRFVTGLRAGGEKLHESLLNPDETLRTVENGGRYIVQPAYRSWGGMVICGFPLDPSFIYRSDLAPRLSVAELRNLL